MLTNHGVFAEAAGEPDRRVFVIDEVQRVPALLDVVHAQIEARADLRFVLTASSARKLRRAGVNLLAGRAVHRAMHPFLAAELGDAFDLGLALRAGDGSGSSRRLAFPSGICVALFTARV